MSLTNRNIASLLSPAIAFSKVNVFDVLYFCMVHAVLNTSIHQLLYLYNPIYGVKFDKFMVAGMMLGDISGSYLIFILLNLVFSLVSRLLGLSATATND